MKLRDLKAYFVRYAKGVADSGHGRPMPDGSMQWGGFEIDVIHHVDTLAEAQGIWFLCPICFAKNGGSVGTHSVEVTFEGRGAAPEQGSRDLSGTPSRWAVLAGTGLDDLCLSPSILLGGPGCGWHGFIGCSGVPAGEAK